MADGESTINLSDFKQGRARHADLVTWSALAWRLLALESTGGRGSLVLPQRHSTSLRHLARSGVIAAAHDLPIDLRHSDGRQFDYSHLFEDPERNHAQLPGTQWKAFDELDGDELRVVPDLANPRHRIPPRSWSGLVYPWLGCLGLRSVALSGTGYGRFLSSADRVILELIQNVHWWSRADRAFAAVSVTKGGGGASWNRLHVVVADNGVGIPNAIRRSLAAYPDSASCFDSLSDLDILTKLLFRGRHGRGWANHDGDGIYKSQRRAAEWVGALDILTTDGNGAVLRAGTRGLDETSLETEPVPDIPGARGTLVHVMLQAVDDTDAREEAAREESLPFDTSDYDDTISVIYEPDLAIA